MWRNIDTFEMFDLLKEENKRKSTDEYPCSLTETTIEKGVCLICADLGINIFKDITIKKNPYFDFHVKEKYIVVKSDKTVITKERSTLFEAHGSVDKINVFIEKVYDAIKELPDYYFAILQEMTDNILDSISEVGQYIGDADKESLFFDTEEDIKKVFLYHVIKVEAPELDSVEE